MSEDAGIRRENLHRLLAGRGWTIAEFSARMGGNQYSYWRALLAESGKSFGEKVARRIEDTLHLPRRWLDEIDQPLPLLSEEPQPGYRPIRWLFSDDLFDACALLDDGERRRLEQVMRAHLGLLPGSGDT